MEAPVDPDDPGDDTDMSTTSGSVEDVRKRPKKLQNVLGQVRKCLKERTRQDSPSRPGEESDKPDGETVIPGNFQMSQQRPRSVSNERVDETNAPCQRNSLDGHLGEPEASRGVEGVRDCGTVVDGAGHDGIRPSSDGSECRVETNTLRRDKGPRGHMGELERLRGVEGDWDRCRALYSSRLVTQVSEAF